MKRISIIGKETLSSPIMLPRIHFRVLLVAMLLHRTISKAYITRYRKDTSLMLATWTPQKRQ
nr:MAG TPA: hypothetical protein [Bacteriophage sp.]